VLWNRIQIELTQIEIIPTAGETVFEFPLLLLLLLLIPASHELRIVAKIMNK